MGVRWVWCAAVLLSAAHAAANVASFGNNKTGDGRLTIGTDEYGTYGFQLQPATQDNFQPAGDTSQPATMMTVPFLTLTTPDAKVSVVGLSDDPKFRKFVQGSMAAPAIQGMHTGLQRTTTGFSATSTTGTTSAFRVASTTNTPAIDIGVTLVQAMSFDAGTATTRLDQTYTFTNSGASSIDLAFTAWWDPDLIWTSGIAHNVPGVGVGRCYVYVRDDSAPDQAVLLTDGGSTVPVTGYYGGKAGSTRTPDYDPKMPLVFTNFGMPAAWRDDLSRVGYDMAGEATNAQGIGDADMALEWAFTLPIGGSETIVVRRIYGTFTIVCPAGPSCGTNATVDPGEDCETQGVDTAECVGAACRFSTCGDGYVNPAAGEECEANLVDNPTCVGATCKLSACGDGHVNAAAGEQCDDGGESPTCNIDCKPAMCGDGTVNRTAGEECEEGELCDPVICKFDFSLGGGCAGCNSRNPDAGWLLGFGLLAVAGKRRRYNSRRSS